MTTINCRGKLFDLGIPRVMGILNITSDSFYDGGKYQTESKIIKRVDEMLENGADIIDIGAVSTRPNAKIVDLNEEIKKLLPVLELILKRFPDIIISVDTYRSEVARQSIEYGASIINDISGGMIDKNMFDTIAELKCPYILSHIQGTPETMQINPYYENIISEMIAYFSKKIDYLRNKGVNDIIIDPGFGFGKTIEHNYEILKNLKYFNFFQLPIMIGVSRKYMIYKLLNQTSQEALNGTSVVNILGLISGVSILRVHDVKEAKDVIKIFKMLNI
jgi:dihydropteroate synthase